MAWKVTIAGKSMLVDDLPIDTVSAVALRHDVNWLSLLYRPASHPNAFKDLVVAIASNLDVPAPKMETLRDIEKVLLDDLEEVPDDLPTEFTNGNPPVADALQTDGNSGLSAQEDQSSL